MVFEYKVKKEGAHALIQLTGELIEKGQAASLIASAETLIKEGNNKWAIDLGDLKYMNSSGLNILIQLLTKARVAGGEAVIFNLNKKINELILITKLNTLFKISDSYDKAVKILEP